MKFNSRPSYLEINLQALKHNFSQVRQVVKNCQIMAIVKANAYGHGLEQTALALEQYGASQLGVAYLEEGIALRQAGVCIPILVLGGLLKSQLDQYLYHDLQITASSIDKLHQINEEAKHASQQANIHLKIDTGMERIGVHQHSAKRLIEEALQAKYVEICGIFSHLAEADTPESPKTYQQLEIFHEVLSYFEKISAPVPTRHLANSSAVIAFPETHLDMVRPGMILYGVYPSEAVPKTLDVRPVLSLHTKIVYFKVINQGAKVGYGGTWQAPQQTRLLTLPVGYGDGYPHSLPNHGKVLIHGKPYPIVGSICMDQMTINLGWDSAYNGDDVVLIGQSGQEAITVEELAKLADTIPYEILVRLNERLPRHYTHSSF